MKIVIRHPRSRPSERNYIFDVIFEEFLGVGTKRIAEDRDDVCLSVDSTDAQLFVADILFATDESDWLAPQSMPAEPLPRFRGAELPGTPVSGSGDDIPILYGSPVSDGRYLERQDGVIRLGIDVFGSAFFMLTRYEEACHPEKDEYGRFPYAASLAYRERFNERPIVNEYLELLWNCLLDLVPGLTRRPRAYRCILSHDVDRLFDTRGRSWPAVARNAFGDLARRADPSLAARRIYSKIVAREDDFSAEPCSTFDFIMDGSERAGLTSAFNFIPIRELENNNGDYTIDMPWVRRLIKSIDDRGHELGLHASYQSFDDPGRIRDELARLRTIASEEGSEPQIAGGRQHYLRWAVGTTWEAWNDAGLAYDSTLAYAESCGFRCGTCYEFPVFSLARGEALQLRERPLVLMETSLIGRDYMGLDAREALGVIERLSSACRMYGGSFTMLWHNDRLASRRLRRLYLDALDAVA